MDTCMFIASPRGWRRDKLLDDDVGAAAERIPNGGDHLGGAQRCAGGNVRIVGNLPRQIQVAHA